MRNVAYEKIAKATPNYSNELFRKTMTELGHVYSEKKAKAADKKAEKKVEAKKEVKVEVKK